MTQPSITSTDSFAVRAQRSETTRVVIWIVILVGMLVATLVRRMAGGVVMSHAPMFYPYAGVLVAAIVCQVALLRVLKRENRNGSLLPPWVWRASAIFDLSVAAALLVIASFFSPRGALTALSAPPLLLFPLVVMLSVLRLRSNFTLYAGLAAAAVHLLLAVRAIVVTDVPFDTVYLTYSFILLLIAFAGMFVTAELRRHVLESALEAAAHERLNRQVVGMQRDLTVARDIQRGLLPARPPELEGFEIVGMNRPADATGGDYYDWQAMPDGKLVVVLADVAGHGIGPAIVMAVCRAYARAAAPILPNPTALLKRLNDLLHDDLPSDRFITFVLAVLDASGEVELVSAGHGPTLLYRAATRQITQFAGDGLPLGIMPGEEYGPGKSLVLDEGDVLLMLSDGFFEWARPSDKEQFGIPRLIDALQCHASGNASSILLAIDECVRKYCDGAPQPDDMTAIVIKRMVAARVPVHQGGSPASVVL